MLKIPSETGQDQRLHHIRNDIQRNFEFRGGKDRVAPMDAVQSRKDSLPDRHTVMPKYDGS